MGRIKSIFILTGILLSLIFFSCDDLTEPLAEKIEANYGLTEFTLTIIASEGGSVSKASIITRADKPVSISATADSNYNFVNWEQIDGNGTITIDDNGSSSTEITLSGGNVSLRANFSKSSRFLSLKTTNLENIDEEAGNLNFENDYVLDGESIPIVASASEDYEFVQWIQSNSEDEGAGTVTFNDDDITQADTEIAISGGPVQLEAQFQLRHYNIKLKGTSGTSISVNGTNYALEDSVSVKAKSNISINASGSGDFVNWQKVGGTGVINFSDSTDANTIISISGGDIVLKASYATFLIKTYFETTEGGRIIEPQTDNDTGGDHSYLGNDISSRITAEADADYKFIEWTDENTSTQAVFDDSSNIDTNVTINGAQGLEAKIKAHFQPVTYTINIIENPNGSASFSPDTDQLSETATIKDTLNIYAEPLQGKEFAYWEQTGGTGTVSFEDSSSNNTTITVSGGDVSIQAVFSDFLIKTYFSAQNGGNIVTPQLQNDVNGDYASLAVSTVIPIAAEVSNDEYQFSQWSKTNGTAEVLFEDPFSNETTVNVTGINSDTAEIEAAFTIKNHEINIISNTDGTASFSSDNTELSTTATYEDTISIYATPATDLDFASWEQVEGGTGTVIFSDSTSAETTMTISGGNAYIQAVFVDIEARNTSNDLTVQSTTGGNIILPTESTTSLAEGTALPITAEPASSAYVFTQWKFVSGTGTVTFGDENKASTTIKLSGGDATIQANFVLKEYKADFSVSRPTGSSTGSITTPASSSITVNHGQAFNILATQSNEAGILFSHWSYFGTGSVTFSDRNALSTSATAIDGDVTIIANYTNIEARLRFPMEKGYNLLSNFDQKEIIDIEFYTDKEESTYLYFSGLPNKEKTFAFIGKLNITNSENISEIGAISYDEHLFSKITDINILEDVIYYSLSGDSSTQEIHDIYAFKNSSFKDDPPKAMEVYADFITTLDDNFFYINNQDLKPEYSNIYQIESDDKYYKDDSLFFTDLLAPNIKDSPLFTYGLGYIEGNIEAGFISTIEEFKRTNFLEIKGPILDYDHKPDPEGKYFDILYLAKGLSGLSIIQNKEGTLETLWDTSDPLEDSSYDQVKVYGNYLFVANSTSKGNFIQIFDIHIENGALIEPAYIDQIATDGSGMMSHLRISDNNIYLIENGILKIFNYELSRP